MFEVIEKVTKTEVESLAVFTCDMCGDKKEGPEDEEWTPSEWIALNPIDQESIDLCATLLCPTCAEKVRSFIVCGVTWQEENKRLKAQLEDLKKDCRDFLEKQVVYTNQYLDEKNRADSLEKELEQSRDKYLAAGYDDGHSDARRELSAEIIELKRKIKVLERDNEKHEKKLDELKEEKERLNGLVDEQQDTMVRVMDHSAKLLNSKHTNYAEACADLKPRDWVLGRDGDNSLWEMSVFSYMHKNLEYVCINGAYWDQCLPYEPYKHLLGTTKGPWEG